MQLMSLDPVATLLLTSAQEALVQTLGSIFADACPGAGKTQAVVQRFIRRPNVTDRRGVALLSFTNAAVDEVRTRCENEPQLLQVPNFVGTFDSFIGRFIVGPIHRWREGQWPSIKDSWDAVPGSVFRVPAAQRDFQLGWFRFDPQGRATFDESKVPSDRKHLIGGLASWQLTAASREAAVRYARFTANGVMVCDDIRELMWRFLDDDISGGKIARILEARFKEVIVDEVQDCGPNEARLIHFLLDSGIEVVAVGDLEQNIFGFRGSCTLAVQSIKERIGSVPRLDQNFRSSPSICMLIDSLRAGTERDRPVGDSQSADIPIQLLRTTSQTNIKAKILEITWRCGFAPPEIIVLAHAGADARASAGGVASNRASDDRVVRLARSASALQSSRLSPQGKVQKLAEFASIVRGLAAEELRYLGDRELFEAVDLDARAFRTGCLRLAYRQDPYAISPSQYKEEIKAGIKALGWHSWLDLQRLRAPSGNAWKDRLPSSETLQCSTIHSFKGLQWPVVALVIPKVSNSKESGVSYWRREEAHEARRVLYVGASRAQRLLILVVDDSQWTAVQHCLDRDRVPYDCHA